MKREFDVKVSIIVPIYNDERYITFCLEAIIHQTYENIEIILVDDASKDSSLDICRSYACCDSRIKVIHNDKNRGLSKSREIGYDHATGDWICFADHDDRMNLRALELLVGNADETIDIVAAKYKNILSGDFEKYEFEHTKLQSISLTHDEALNMLGSFGRYEVSECLWGKIYRRKLFDKTEIKKYEKQFPLVYFEDVMLTSALIDKCSNMKILNQYIYIHRVDYSSVSMSPDALAFNLETAYSADIVLSRVHKPYAMQAYARVMQNYLLVFAKNWYLVRTYHNRNKALLDSMKDLFSQYYDIYRNLDEKTPAVPKLCINIFHINRKMFCVLVCKLWFQCVSKIRYRIKSK